MDRSACSFASAEKIALHGCQQIFLLDFGGGVRRAPIERSVFLLDYAEFLRRIPMDRFAGIFIKRTPSVERFHVERCSSRNMELLKIKIADGSEDPVNVVFEGCRRSRRC